MQLSNKIIYAKRYVRRISLLLLVVGIFLLIPNFIIAAPLLSSIILPGTLQHPGGSFVIHTDRDNYFTGEIVNITFESADSYFGNNQDGVYLEIQNIADASYAYNYLGVVGDSVLFNPKQSGTYVIRVYDAKNSTYNLISQKYFSVHDSDSSCNVLHFGDPITVDMTKYNYTSASGVYLLYYDLQNNFLKQYKYNDALKSTIYFNSPDVGRYYLFIDEVYADCFYVDRSILPSGNVNDEISKVLAGVDYIENISSGFGNPLGLSNVVGEDVNAKIARYYEQKSIDDISKMIGEDVDINQTEKNALNSYISRDMAQKKQFFRISGTGGELKNSFIVMKNQENNSYIEGSIVDINNDTINPRLYQTDIYFPSSIIQRIHFKNLNYSSGVDLSVEDLPVSQLTWKNDTSMFISAFAIDPSRLSFDSAVITFNAVGNVLWKCKDYDFLMRTCNGNFVKVMDIIPGMEYSFTIDNTDPVFTQSTYLVNQYFENDTTSWTTLTEGVGTNLAYNWNASDSGQNGVAEIASGAANGVTRTGSYYQVFNLSIPKGTNLTNISFSSLWRISTYNNPGSAHFWIQNSAQAITYCVWNQSFSSTTSWTTALLQTNGSNNCFLSNFTAYLNYTFRIRCILVTSAVRNERCHWDNTSITAYYIDVQAPNITNISDAPDPVNYSKIINFTANITDNIQIDDVWISINNTNYTMNYSSGNKLYYLDTFNTSTFPRTYNYTVYVNDTSNNIASKTGNFTINDTIPPAINLMTIDNYYSNSVNTYLYYNVSDESNITNCSLRVDSSIKYTNTTVQENVQQSLNSTLTYGLHYWNITCYDTSTNKNVNTSSTRSVTMDNVSPVLGLTYPKNNTWISGYPSKMLYFNFTPIDDFLNNCSLYGNFSGAFSLNSTILSLTNNSMNSLNTSPADGNYLWNVQCCDKASNCAFNETNLTLKVDSTPPLSFNLSTPANATITKNNTPLLNWTKTNDTNFANYTILVDNDSSFSSIDYQYSISNISNLTYQVPNNTPWADSKWYWEVLAYDLAGNTNSTTAYEYTVDTTPPSVKLSTPPNNSALGPGNITFNYIPYDIRLKNCSIYTNITGLWKLNSSNTSPTNNATNNFVIYLNFGNYLWNVQCCDTVGNCGFNDTNNTVMITGDLSIPSVYFSNQNPAEGDNITIFAVASNLANISAQNVLIRFYENDPDINGVQIGSDIYRNISAYTNLTVNVTWTALKGTHLIYTKIDPQNNITESNESNNKNYNTTFIASWQVFYGNFTTAIVAIGSNTTLVNWNIKNNVTGNVYIADSDSSISWAFLTALGRNTTGGYNASTLDDFSEVDTCLNISQYADNINQTYTSNGQPIQTTSYTIFNTIINNVSIAKSTNNTNFFTGILWDSSDSTDKVYSCKANPASREDIVFVAKINPSMPGKYGTYDYEIRVPGDLGSYKGSVNSVALYYEIK